jgi:hypothetical protein
LHLLIQKGRAVVNIRDSVSGAEPLEVVQLYDIAGDADSPCGRISLVDLQCRCPSGARKGGTWRAIDDGCAVSLVFDSTPQQLSLQRLQCGRQHTITLCVAPPKGELPCLLLALIV